MLSVASSARADELDNAAEVLKQGQSMTDQAKMEAFTKALNVLVGKCGKKGHSPERAKSCFLMGAYSVSNHQSAQAITYLNEACASKYPKACYLLALANDEGGRPHLVEEILQQACKSKDTSSCEMLSKLNERIEKLEKEQPAGNETLRGGSAGIVKPWQWTDGKKWISGKKFKGYGTFTYPITADSFFGKYKIAFKTERLMAMYSEAGSTLSDTLAYQQCLKYVKDDKWKNDNGYSMNVIIFDIVLCPTN